MQNEFSRETYSIFPNILGHGTLFTEYLEGSVPAKPTLGNPVHWVQWHPPYQAVRVGYGDMCKVPRKISDQWSLALFPHQTMKAGVSFWKIRAKVHKGNLKKHSFRKATVNGVKCQVYNFLAVWSGSSFLDSLKNDARMKSENLVFTSYCIINYHKTEWLNTHLLFHSFCW